MKKRIKLGTPGYRSNSPRRLFFCCCLMFVVVFLGYNQYWSSGFIFFLWFYVQEHPKAHRKPILVTHIRTVFRTYSRKVLILISRLCFCCVFVNAEAKAQTKCFLIIPVCSFAARLCNWYDCISMGLITIVR